MKIASHIISIIFNPILMPTIGIVLIFNTGTHLSLLPAITKQVITVLIFVTTAVLPMTILPLLYQFKIIKTLFLENKRERVIPMVITVFFYYLGFLLLKKIGMPTLLNSFFLASIISVLIAAFVSYFWKISIHTMGIGGVTGVLFALSIKFGIDIMPLISMVLLASGLTASARLYLSCHNTKQIFVGYLCGFLVVFGFIFLSF
ncbi:MAG: PAP2 family protein [Marinilabiliaceae bacterium]|nr:PAP2 family protein [Marinilabiliaceae bacterium]